MILFKQSTARNIPFFMVDSTDSITGKTGLSPTVTLSKDGGAFAGAGGSVTEIGNGWYNLAATTTDTGTLGCLLLHATATGADPFDELHQVVVDLPGATVSSVTGSVGSVTGAVGSVTGNVGGNVVGSVASVVGAVGSVTGNVGGNVVGSVASVTAAVTAGTVSDKTGYSLSAGGIQAIWDALTSALTTVNSIGKLLVTNINAAIGSIPTNPLLTSDSRLNNLDAAVSSRLATSGYTAPDNTDIATIVTATNKLQFDGSNNVKSNVQVNADKPGTPSRRPRSQSKRIPRSPASRSQCSIRQATTRRQAWV